MTRFKILLAAIASLVPLTATAQYNSSPIEHMCYGGRNQMGLHICACDQTLISGLSALILGNSTPMTGASKLQDCLAWADRMNGVANTPATPPKVVTQPKLPKLTPKPPMAQIPRLPDAAGRCGAQFNACTTSGGDDCASLFNSCESERVETNRDTAVKLGLIGADTAQEWASFSTGTAFYPGTGTDAPDGKGTAKAIPLFNKIEKAPSDKFSPNLSRRFVIDPGSYDGKAYDMAPPRTVTITPTAASRVYLAGSADGTKEVYVDNILVICINNSACLSAGRRDAEGLAEISGGIVNKLPGATDFHMTPDRLNITGYLIPDQPNRVTIHAIDFGGVGGISDLFLIVEGGAASDNRTTTTVTQTAEQRIRSKPFNFQFDCPVSVMNGQVKCAQNYWAKYVPPTNTWEVCGRLATKTENMCLSYANAPAKGAALSVWGEVMQVTGDGMLIYNGQRVGTVDLGSGVLAPRRVRDIKLPPLSEKPPALGMPGNRSGSARGSFARWGYH